VNSGEVVMRVRIIATSSGLVDGVDTSHFRRGHVYDLPAALAMFLILHGRARLELRSRDRDDSDRHGLSGLNFQTDS
jgi:hypothetical protein